MLLNAFALKATHNRAGSITYRHISGNRYEFTIKTCTKSSSDADRNELRIEWGDGTSDTIPRTSIVPDPNVVSNPPFDLQQNTYVGTHDFSGPGTYIISVEDPNRNASIQNITSSVNVPFCIQTELIISPFIGSPNNSIVIEGCPCPEFACTNSTYCFNISAYDPDGDSLSYSLVPCLGQNCLEMSIPQVYRFPDTDGGGVLTIDSITGTLCWENPVFPGEYNVAIKISEFRNGAYIGSVLQDMQISVETCVNNPPNIEDRADTCIFVGETTEINFAVTDPDQGDFITTYATGRVFNLPANPAIYDTVTGLSPIIGTFKWTPNCDQASPNSYPIIVHAFDNDSIQLSDLLTYRIKVNVPPVDNVQASPLGAGMQVIWNPISESLNCQAVSYNVYRSFDSTSTSDECCEKGYASSIGYELIGNTTDTSFLDQGSLVIGNEYCYMVTILLPNGVESCISNQSCSQLKFEIPIMTNVSVIETDISLGKDSIIWSWPKELDFVTFPGPYYYELYRSDDFNVNSDELIYTTPINSDITLVDSFYFDENLNTEGQAYNYYVKLFSNNIEVGMSTNASSIWLTSTPNDNRLTLNWTENVPWVNEYYKVYRESPTGSGNFIFIDSTEASTYTDTGLVNLSTYCYKIQSVGGYAISGVTSPLINWSQKHCGVPTDNTPPCPPTAFISGDCDLEETYISWTNPNKTCADDVVKYNLYFAPFEGDSLEFLAEIGSDLDTFYTHKDRGSIAGCYYVTAIDSLPNSNESLPSNLVCIDNCDGFYILPNVFTPNGNQVNDLYHPLLPYKFVESIDLTIFNRYGVPVHYSTNPSIDWDATYLDTGEPVSDGIYYYNCTVNLIKLTGIESKLLTGTITILNSK